MAYYRYELRSTLPLGTIWKHRICHLGRVLDSMPWFIRRVRIRWGHIPCLKRKYISNGIIYQRYVILINPFLLRNGSAGIQLRNCPLFDPFSTKWSIVREYKTDLILCQLPKHLQNAHARQQQNQRQRLANFADLPKLFSLWITTKEILKAEWKFTTTKWTPYCRTSPKVGNW